MCQIHRSMQYNITQSILNWGNGRILPEVLKYHKFLIKLWMKNFNLSLLLMIWLWGNKYVIRYTNFSEFTNHGHDARKRWIHFLV